MSIPGFTGDSSIYKITSYYRMGAISEEGRYPVHPALFNIPIET
jgi:hypothetical protein